ncbi:MAG: diguanylate cyclase [Candidatus Aminicenantes bacterium]|nr:diguanylate cyclase [Candidatus Aminicenantes bacterium]
MRGKAERRPARSKSKSLFFSLCFFFGAFISSPGVSSLNAAEEFRWANLSHPLRLGSLTVEQGLSQSSVFCTLQDRRGFLWFGTEDGLNRYDGYSFRIFRPGANDPRSISSNYILSLVEDPSGLIWVGTSGGGLDMYNPESETFKIFRPGESSDSLPNDVINCLFLDRKERLWIGTEAGLCVLDRSGGLPENPSFRRIELADTGSNITAIHEDRRGGLWIGTATGQVARIEDSDKGFRPVSVLSGFEQVTAVGDDGGVLLVGTPNGLFLADPERHSRSAVLPRPEDPSSISHTYIRRIYRDRGGLLWIGTDGGGLNKMMFDRERARYVFARYQHDPSNASGLRSNAIESLYEDRSGVLWIGTYLSGLNKLVFTRSEGNDRDQERFAQFWHIPGEAGSLPGGAVASFCEDRQGKLWVGTEGGGLCVLSHDQNPWSPARFQVVSDTRGRPVDVGDTVVTALLADSHGSIWVGTYRGGLTKLMLSGNSSIPVQTDRFTLQPGKPGSLSSNFILEIHEDSRGVLWIGTIDGGLNRFDASTQRFISYRTNAADPGTISNDNVNTILDDGPDTLWVGTINGLNLLNVSTGRFVRFLPDPARPGSLPNPFIRSLHRDHKGDIWIGTNGGGLCRLVRQGTSPEDWTFKVFSSSSAGLPNDVIYGILEDGAGRLWLSTNKGLARFDPVNGSVRSFTRAHGLQGDEFSRGAFFESRTGELFFGGGNGFNVFHPDDVRDNETAPEVAIVALQLFNQDVPIGPLPDKRTLLARSIPYSDRLNLSYADKIITFEFAALNFVSPSLNRYSYRMEGLEEKWNNVGTRRIATFTTLPPGDYVFHVRASNGDGIWNMDGQRILIHIKPPFWKTRWFVAIAIFSFLGLILAVFRVRIANLKRRGRELERIVEQKTHELREMSLTDPLTGLRNRRFLTEVLSTDIQAFLDFKKYVLSSRNSRRGLNEVSVFGVFMLDIDHFKQLNDRFGHEAGDRFLREFGRLLKDSIRLNDVVVRTGGEEFLVVLKNTDIAYLDLFATKILGKIAEQSFVLSEVEGRTIHKTCSVGYSAFPLVDAEPDRYNFDQIIMLADQALYYAKAHGRNQAVRVLAGSERPENPEQTEKLLRNLEYGEQKGYIETKIFYQPKEGSSGPIS